MIVTALMTLVCMIAFAETAPFKGNFFDAATLERFAASQGNSNNGKTCRSNADCGVEADCVQPVDRAPWMTFRGSVTMDVAGRCQTRLQRGEQCVPPFLANYLVSISPGMASMSTPCQSTLRCLIDSDREPRCLPPTVVVQTALAPRVVFARESSEASEASLLPAKRRQPNIVIRVNSHGAGRLQTTPAPAPAPQKQSFGWWF